jgi:hypothetical protein
MRIQIKVKTTPENVREANEGLFRSTMNLPNAAQHCGMTQKEMKMTFREFLKYNLPDYDTTGTGTVLNHGAQYPFMIDETEGGI